MTQLKKMFPLLIACFISAAGIFFLVNAVFEPGLLTIKASGKIWVFGIAIVLTGSGLLFVYLARANKLRKEGPLVTEVRKEAVGGLKSESLLHDIAQNDPKAEVRRTARQRLEELHAQ
jgi:hypothetical protein